jgi:putative flippase GtrA
MLATVRVLRYGLIGTGAALLQLSLLILFVEFLHLNSLLASTAALAISVVVNYGLQRHFTFRSKSRHVIAGPQFFLFTMVTLAANALLFGAMSAIVPYLLAQIITTATIFPVNYYLNKTFTFRC